MNDLLTGTYFCIVCQGNRPIENCHASLEIGGWVCDSHTQSEIEATQQRFGYGTMVVSARHGELFPMTGIGWGE